MRCFSLFIFLFYSTCSNCQEPHFNFGKVSLENSGSPQAQEMFLQGLAALHSFEYKEAIIDFKEAEKIDPNFALAYWGEAMANNHSFWRQQDLEAAKEVMSRLEKIPKEQLEKLKPLEKDLIQSLNILFGPGTKEERDQKYSDYMAQLYAKYPKNVEVLSLYALSILGTIQPGDTSYRKNMKAVGVLDAALGFNPPQELLNHPGVLHYYIHSLDDPIHAILALKAANRYAGVAPDAAHALHMPSHIYVQLGMWEKARQSNIDSYAASIRWVNQRTKQLADRQYHSLYWLMYANLHLGRYKEAKKNVDEIIDLTKTDKACEIEGHWALMSARYIVETKDCFLPFSKEDIQKMRDCYVSDEPQAYSFAYALGFCALNKKEFEEADFAIKSLRELRENLEQNKTRTTRILNDNDKKYRINILTIQIEELLAIKDQLDGDMLGALDRLETAAKIEMDLPLPNGIPVPVQSAIELYADLLMQDKQLEKAKQMYLKALDRTPNRAKIYLQLAIAMQKIGDQEASKKYAQKALANWANADGEFPELDKAKLLNH